MDPNVLWSSLGVWQLWMVLLVTFGLGAVGGLIHANTQSPGGAAGITGRIALSWRQALTGGLAAIAVLYAVAPEPGIKWVASALLAGYVGDAVMAALGARFIAALAQRNAEDARDLAARAHS